MKKIKLKNIIFSEPIIILFFSFFLLYFYKNSKNFIEINSKDGFQEATAISNNKNCRIKQKDNSCLNFVIKDLNKNKSILFLGNSQSGSINNFIEGESDFITNLNKKSFFNSKKFTLNSLWMPNASLVEFSEIIKGLSKCKIEPEIIVIPAFLDDTREQTIRNQINNFENLVCNHKDINKKEKKVIKSNVKILNNSIKKNIPLFSHIQSINTQFRTDLYKLRNLVFRIKPTSVRPIKKASYFQNIKALEEIFQLRNKNNLSTYVYIPPLLFADKPNKIPYSGIEYKNFKYLIEKICIKYNCKFFNLENTLPYKYWGTKTSTTFFNKKDEIDFMHFNGEGHKIFSEKIFSILKNHIKEI